MKPLTFALVLYALLTSGCAEFASGFVRGMAYRDGGTGTTGNAQYICPFDDMGTWATGEIVVSDFGILLNVYTCPMGHRLYVSGR